MLEQRCAFVFAHYDDGALDATHAMLRCAPRSIDMVLCTGVPDRSLPPAQYGEWDRVCGFPDPWSAMRSRVDEHRLVCQEFGLATVGLGDLDSQYGESSAVQDAALTATVTALRNNDIRVVVTHGLDASHPDHARASRIATAAANVVGLPVVTVCDRPYTDCSDGCMRGDEPGDHDTVVLDDTEWQRKRAAVDAYPSQHIGLTDSFGDWFTRRLLGTECLHRA